MALVRPLHSTNMLHLGTTFLDLVILHRYRYVLLLHKHFVFEVGHFTFSFKPYTKTLVIKICIEFPSTQRFDLFLALTER